MGIARFWLFVGTVLPSCATISLRGGTLTLKLLGILLKQIIHRGRARLHSLKLLVAFMIECNLSAFLPTFSRNMFHVSQCVCGDKLDNLTSQDMLMVPRKYGHPPHSRKHLRFVFRSKYVE